jgi:hypothetical protein
VIREEDIKIILKFMSALLKQMSLKWGKQLWKKGEFSFSFD